MNWRRITRYKNVPPSQASLALGVIGLGHAWALYFPSVGMSARPYMVALGAIMLFPVLLKYLTSPRTFITEIRHPLNGSLLAPMSMSLLILCDYLAVIAPKIAYPIWFIAIMLHFSMMVLFFLHVSAH